MFGQRGCSTTRRRRESARNDEEIHLSMTRPPVPRLFEPRILRRLLPEALPRGPAEAPRREVPRAPIALYRGAQSLQRQVFELFVRRFSPGGSLRTRRNLRARRSADLAHAVVALQTAAR
jgi:hypothetical protein